jgi:hypothetical protein
VQAIGLRCRCNIILSRPYENVWCERLHNADLIGIFLMNIDVVTGVRNASFEAVSKCQ